MLICEVCSHKVADKLAYWLVKENLPFCSERCLIDYCNTENKSIQEEKMAKLKDYAKSYESSTTKNIADLSEVSTEVEVTDDQFETIDKKTNLPKTVKQKVITVEGIAYRVPVSVVEQLKIVLEDNPNLKKFKVKKSGTGMETKYQVIPLM